jgi:hypothetical protein
LRAVIFSFSTIVLNMAAHRGMVNPNITACPDAMRLMP